MAIFEKICPQNQFAPHYWIVRYATVSNDTLYICLLTFRDLTFIIVLHTCYGLVSIRLNLNVNVSL